ncbi:MAG: hypothetical protein ACR2LN_08185 [Candidatus Levyibacteriota bacterium]
MSAEHPIITLEQTLPSLTGVSVEVISTKNKIGSYAIVGYTGTLG